MLTFSGSSNHNYANYLFRLWVMLKYEFSDDLRHLITQNMLVNPEGIPGHIFEGDKLREHHNLHTEELVQHKGLEYGDEFVRSAISPNIHDLKQLRDEMEKRLGLKLQSKAHTSAPRGDAIKTLLKIYAEKELHAHRAGRTYGRLTDDEERLGYDKLDSGRLKKYITAALNTTDGDFDDDESESDGSEVEPESEDELWRDDEGREDLNGVTADFTATRLGQSERAGEEDTWSEDSGDSDIDMIEADGRGEESEDEAFDLLSK